MNELQIFKSQQFGEIRVIEKDGEPWFVGKDVADILGYSETNAMTKRLDKEDFISDKLEGMNMKSTLINESGLYAAIIGSHLTLARPFKRWVTSEVLPSIRKHGSYSVYQETKSRIPFTEQVESVNIVSNMLNVNEAGKILMLQKLYRSYDLPYEFLPKYEDNGSREYKSATELLKRFNLDMSARAFNILLMDKGYLEERTRASSKNKSTRRKYKALSEKGLNYGENLISPQNQRETQPMYYIDTFMELFEMITQ